MDTQGWEITKLRAENERLEKELTMKPEWHKEDYIQELQAENDRLKRKLEDTTEHLEYIEQSFTARKMRPVKIA